MPTLHEVRRWQLPRTAMEGNASDDIRIPLTFKRGGPRAIVGGRTVADHRRLKEK